MSRITNDDFEPGAVVMAASVNSKMGDLATASASLDAANVRSGAVDVGHLEAVADTFIKHKEVVDNATPVTVQSTTIANKTISTLVTMNLPSGVSLPAGNLLRLYYQVLVTASAYTGDASISTQAASFFASHNSCFVCWLEYHSDGAGTWLPVPTQSPTASITVGSTSGGGSTYVGYGFYCGTQTAPQATSIMTIPIAHGFSGMEQSGVAPSINRVVYWNSANNRSWTAMRSYFNILASPITAHGFRVRCMGVFGGNVTNLAISENAGALSLRDDTAAGGSNTHLDADGRLTLTVNRSQLAFIHMRAE